MTTLATWSTKNGNIKVTTDERENGLGLAVWLNDRLAGFNFTAVEKAQALVNRLADKVIWSN